MHCAKYFLCFLSVTFYAQEIQLTFIIPCYNRATIVGDAIESIYNQQLSFNFEVICTDDGSTDNTFEVLQSYKKRYHNFKVFRHEENRGASEARNTCVKHASGSLIFNLDSDNILVEGSIQRLVDFMRKKGVEAAAFSEVRYFSRENKVLERCHSEYWTDERKELNIKNDIFDLTGLFCSAHTPPASGNYLYTKDSYYRAGGYSGEGQETWVFGFKQLATGTKFAILPHSYYWHALSPDSYWWVLERRGLNDQHALSTVKKFSRLFTPETIRFLRFYDKKRSFFCDINKDCFRIRPLEELEKENISLYYTKKIGLKEEK